MDDRELTARFRAVAFPAPSEALKERIFQASLAIRPAVRPRSSRRKLAARLAILAPLAAAVALVTWLYPGAGRPALTIRVVQETPEMAARRVSPFSDAIRRLAVERAVPRGRKG